MLKSGEKLKHLRGKLGISQEEMSEILGITRPTYSLIERGEREIKIDEANKLSKELGVDPQVFFTSESEPEFSDKEEYSCNTNKFKNLILYVLEQCGAKPNVGETVLYKLLYFVDFNFYRKYGRSLSGCDYRKITFGPVPMGFLQIANEMIEDKQLMQINTTFGGYAQKKYIPLAEHNKQVINEKEAEFIDGILKDYSHMNAKEISEASHREMPWRATPYGDKIDYRLAKLNEKREGKQ